jgi:uncharacterized circularly permuted ATP-grasp superfamily protein
MLVRHLGKRSREEMLERKRAADLAVRALGITFTVNSERESPHDVIPRIAPARGFTLRGNNSTLTPGGRARVALPRDAIVVNSSQGAGWHACIDDLHLQLGDIHSTVERTRLGRKAAASI